MRGWLLVSGAVMHQRDAIAIDAVQCDHFFHPRSFEFFHDGSAGGEHVETGLRGSTVSILTLPFPGQGLQLLEGGFRRRPGNYRRNEESQQQERHPYRHKSAVGHGKASPRQCVPRGLANRTGTHADSLAFSTEEKQQTVASPSQGTRRRKVKGCAGKRVDLSSMLLAVRQHLFQLFRVATSSPARRRILDRKSTRLNSSHQIISYAVFCLKK